MYPFDKDGLGRKISLKLLFKLFYMSGLTANQITIGNFFIFGLGAVILFSLGHDKLGLFIAGIAAMIDYIDGSIARAGRGSPNGQFMDTSLDWLYLMMLVGAISYHHQIMELGYITLIILTFGNWVQYNGGVNIVVPSIIGTTFILTLSILLGHAELGITGIMFIQGIRTGLLYWRAIWNKYRG